MRDMWVLLLFIGGGLLVEFVRCNTVRSAHVRRVSADAGGRCCAHGLDDHDRAQQPSGRDCATSGGPSSPRRPSRSGPSHRPVASLAVGHCRGVEETAPRARCASAPAAPRRSLGSPAGPTAISRAVSWSQANVSRTVSASARWTGSDAPVRSRMRPRPGRCESWPWRQCRRGAPSLRRCTVIPSGRQPDPIRRRQFSTVADVAGPVVRGARSASPRPIAATSDLRCMVAGSTPQSDVQ